MLHTNHLRQIQKEDLQKLKAYEMQKGASEENEAEVVESAINWGELKQPRTVAFYLGFPKWYFWIPFEKNMKNFVDREFKTKSILRISIDAQKKYDKQHGIDKRGSDKNKSEDQVKEEPSSKPKKRSLWIRFVEFTKDRNQKELEREARNRVSNSREAPVKEENLEKDLSDKLKDANLELGEDE